MFSTTPSVCSNWRIALCNWRSSTRRSVITTIESKTRRSLAVVKGGKLVGEPCDGEGLATARRVLDQIAVPRALHSRVGHQPPHAIELLVAREDEEAPAIPPSLDRPPPGPHG